MVIGDNYLIFFSNKKTITKKDCKEINKFRNNAVYFISNYNNKNLYKIKIRQDKVIIEELKLYYTKLVIQSYIVNYLFTRKKNRYLYLSKNNLIFMK